MTEASADYKVVPVSHNVHNIYKLKTKTQNSENRLSDSILYIDRDLYMANHRMFTAYKFSSTPMIIQFDSVYKRCKYEGIHFDAVFFFIAESLIDISFYCVFVLCGLFLGESMCVRDIKSRVM